MSHAPHLYDRCRYHEPTPQRTQAARAEAVGPAVTRDEFDALLGACLCVYPALLALVGSVV